MKLSIITVNLNNGSGLRKTIESVLSQDYVDFEYIIIDGGSQDESVDIIKEYENGINYWISETDTGIYNAMNKGIVKSKGEYLLFINSGDFLSENILNRIISSDSLNSDILYGNAFVVFKNGERELFIPPKELTFNTFFNGTICHQATFIKKELFEKYGMYNEGYKIVSDWIFFLKVIVFEKVLVRYIDETIASVDGHGIGTSDYAVNERIKALSLIAPESIITDYQEMTNLNKITEELRKELYQYKRRFYLANQILTYIKKMSGCK